MLLCIMRDRMQPMEHIRREIFKISQSAMAQIAEVNQATVSRWESGTLEPSRGEMELIRAAARKRRLKWDDRWFFEVAA